MSKKNVLAEYTSEKKLANKYDIHKPKLSLLSPSLTARAVNMHIAHYDIANVASDLVDFAAESFIALSYMSHMDEEADFVKALDSCIDSCIAKFGIDDFLTLTAKAMESGLAVYGRNNWKGEIERSRLLDAGMRHLLAVLLDKFDNPDTGLSHFSHLFANLHMLHGHVYAGTGINDITK